MGEHEGAAGLKVRSQEGPRLLGEGVRSLRADVASPHDPNPSPGQFAGQTGRLGIMENNYVAAANTLDQREGVGVRDAAVVLALEAAQLAFVAGGPV